MIRKWGALLFLGVAGCTEKVAGADGVYTMCRDVAGFSGETIELKGGTFRYWFYSDAGAGDDPSYPLTGSYRISGNTVTLDHPKIHDPSRTLAVVNGVPVLWRRDGLEGWQKDERLQPYAVLLRVDGVTGEPRRDQRPPLASLKSAKLQDRDAREYEERYQDQPAEVRALLRARSEKGQPDRAVYKEAVRKAQETLTADLIRQLVALLSAEGRHRIPAMMILSDLYGRGWSLLRVPAPFLDEPASRRRALNCLVEGIDAARDRYGVEEPLLVFLQAAEIRTMDLQIPEAGVRIKLSINPGNNGYSSDCGSIAPGSSMPKTSRWTDEIKDIVPAVQKWMRAQLEK